MGKDTNQLRQFRQDRDQIAAQMQRVLNDLYKTEAFIGRAIRKKSLLKRAGRVVLTTLKEKAPERSGKLKESMDFITFRKSKNAVFVGPRYFAKNGKPGAPHAHLVEFGFTARNGTFVQGNPFIKQTYEQTKLLVLKNLEDEIQFIIDKFLSGVKRRKVRQ